jgi:hypothetical protein
MFNRSGILFARPSFLEGIGRLFDFGGTLNQYNDSSTPQEADIKALRADWEAVGDALRTALMEQEHAGSHR